MVDLYIADDYALRERWNDGLYAIRLNELLMTLHIAFP